jgi:hypothetical protein
MKFDVDTKVSVDVQELFERMSDATKFPLWNRILHTLAMIR